MNPFFLIFIWIPALEIFLLIKIGVQIGALSTVSLIFLTAIIGVYFAKLQGINTIKSGMVNLYQNKMPIYEIVSGAALTFAAILLIIPGFATDFLGFLLIIPITRKLIFNAFSKKFNKKNNTFEKKDFIEGEYKDEDEK